jgi:hypothetical protein
LLAILLATAAWGIDNTLSRGVADRDPAQVVLAKSGFGRVPITTGLAIVSGEPRPTAVAAGAQIEVPVGALRWVVH